MRRVPFTLSPSKSNCFTLLSILGSDSSTHPYQRASGSTFKTNFLTWAERQFVLPCMWVGFIRLRSSVRVNVMFVGVSVRILLCMYLSKSLDIVVWIKIFSSLLIGCQNFMIFFFLPFGSAPDHSYRALSYSLRAVFDDCVDLFSCFVISQVLQLWRTTFRTCEFYIFIHRLS